MEIETIEQNKTHLTIKFKNGSSMWAAISKDNFLCVFRSCCLQNIYPYSKKGFSDCVKAMILERCSSLTKGKRTIFNSRKNNKLIANFSETIDYKE